MNSKEKRVMTNEYIKTKLQKKFKISFKLMDQCHVNGPNTHPVFQHLKRNTKELTINNTVLNIQWNYSRWILDRDGSVRMYLSPI